MTRISNVRKTTKFKRSIRAISPVIATLLMIAIAVVASLVAYAWVMGYMGTTTSKTGKAIEIPSFARDSSGNLVVYVQNVGQGTVELKPGESLYVNDNLVPINAAGTITIPQGQTVELPTNFALGPTDSVKIKVTTTEGTFMQATGTGSSSSGGSGNPTQYNVVVTQSANGAIAPAGTTSYAAGSTPSFTITPIAGYHIASVTTNAGAQALVSPYVFPALSADATLTATFEANTPVTITLRPNGAGSSTNLDNNDNSYPYMNNWECVDESASDGDSTYVYRDGSTRYDTYAMQDSGMTTGTIQQITVHIMAKISGGVGTAAEYIRTGGTNYNNPSAHTLTTSYVDYTYTWTTNPGTSAAWAWTEIDALQCGVGLYHYNSGSARCTQVWVVVTYIPA
jgi:flagellin-like protein